MRKRELVSLLCLSSCCLVTVIVLWLFLMVPLAGLQCVIVVYRDHTRLLFLFCLKVVGEASLKETQLRSLGLTGGKAVIR